ncbi:MAG: DVU0298 family protein [Bacillota bacterium]
MKQAPARTEITEKVICPFCYLSIDRPKEADTFGPREMPVGCCSNCGAVYAYDATGHNLGAAFIEALVFACNNDWDLAWNLLPEEDYLQTVVEKYDLETHRVIPCGTYEGRRTRGALYFVRLNQDIQEVTREGIEQRLAHARPATPKPAATEVVEIVGEQIGVKPPTKKEVEDLVRAYRIDLLLRAAGQDKKVLWYLNRLLCAGDELLRLRAAEALGKAARVVLVTDPKTVVAVFQGLLKPFADSSASNWGSIDAIGEMIANAPDIFAGYISRLYPLLEDEALRPKVLRALARIAQSRPNVVRSRIFFPLWPFLYDANPQTRAHAVRLLGNLGLPEARESLAGVPGQDTEVELYAEGNITKQKIGQLVAEALEKLEQ